MVEADLGAAAGGVGEGHGEQRVLALAGLGPDEGEVEDDPLVLDEVADHALEREPHPVGGEHLDDVAAADVLVDGRGDDGELAGAEPLLQHVGVQERAVDLLARTGDGAGHGNRELGHLASFFFSANRASRASSR